jgi:Family of unknown function (DUF5994)
MTTPVSGTPRTPAAGTRTDSLPVRLLLARRPHGGSLDGAWWLRTHRPATELTAPVAGLASRGVVVSGLSLSGTGWDSAPGPIRLNDRDVRLIWFAYRARHTVVLGHGGHEIALLVIPPEATQTAGARAMTLTSAPANATGPDGPDG